VKHAGSICGQERELEKEIRELNRQATDVYRRRDFKAEDKIQAKIDALKSQLDALPFTPPPDKPDECRKHHWDAETLRQFGNARCEKCAMQHQYWLEGQARLKDWPAGERKTRQYYQVVDRYRCKPHKHADANEKQRCIEG
jgi:hypothetical protein